VVAFNFSPEFADRVASGEKRQTIRQTKRAKPGDALQLYTGQRTKKCRKLRDAVCESVDYVHIAPDGLTFGDKSKHPRSVDEFARADGFKDFSAMLAWFEKRYGSNHFIGYVHRWKV
jgi:hypothetical protein